MLVLQRHNVSVSLTTVMMIGKRIIFLTGEICSTGTAVCGHRGSGGRSVHDIRNKCRRWATSPVVT